MKKAYTKPEIIFDDFSLATTIAAGCDKESHIPTKGMCYVDFPGFGHLFFSSISACDKPGVEVDGSNGLCYDVPTDGARLFNSL